MMVKKALVGVTLAVTALGTAAGTAAAGDGDSAPHSTAPVGGVLNGDLQAVNDACAAPWHWDGPVQAAVDAGVYQACQEVGGVQKDAPAIDLSKHPVPLPAPVG